MKRQVFIAAGLSCIFTLTIALQGQEVTLNRVRAYGHGAIGPVLILPTDAAVTENGDLYIANDGRNQIQHYSASGEHAGSICPHSKKLDGLMTLAPALGNTLLAGSLASGRMMHLDSQGNVKGELPKKVGVARLQPLRGGGYLAPAARLDACSRLSSENASDVPGHRALVIDAKGRVQHRLVPLPKPKGRDETIQWQVDHAGSAAMDSQGRLWTAHHHINQAVLYDGRGKEINRFNRSTGFECHPPRVEWLGKHDLRLHTSKLTRSMAVDALDRLWLLVYTRPKTQADDIDYRLFIPASGVPVISDISRPEGGAPTDLFALEVYSPDGRFIKTLALDHPADHIRIYGDRLFVIDTFWKQQVTEYRIETGR